MNFYSLCKLSALVSLAITCSTVDAQETGSFERILSVNNPVELDVSTGSGAIEVLGGQSDRVRIIGRIEVRRRFGSAADIAEFISQFEAEPPLELVGSRLRVGALNDENRRGVTISYEIEIPSASTVTSRSGSGGQLVTGIAGPVEVSAGSGAITVMDLAGEVEARAGSGSIHANRVSSTFTARTGSGSVELDHIGSGDIEITTGSGSSRLHGVNGALRVRAGSGSITVDGEQNGRWELETGSGSIRVQMPEDAAFELDARSGSGAIDIDHPVTVQGRAARGSLRGPVRGGGDLLQARTGSGQIRIE